MIYRVTVSLSYEGDSSYDFTELSDAIDCINRWKSTHSFDDIEICRVEYMDIYDLMRD
jgi:hypothetical protein